MQSSNNIYLNRIDVLRFVAATLVIFWHYIHFDVIPAGYLPGFFPFSILEEGHTGVSFFMVLSGFIFQFINDGRQIDFPKFLRNRFFRIFPLAIFWILIEVAVNHLNSVEALLNTIFIFDSQSVPGVGWTIVVEFQFYMIFPVLHKVIEKKSGIWNILGLIALMIIVRSLLYVNVDSLYRLSYFTIFGRLDQFLIGMIAAKLYSSGPGALFFSKPQLEKLRLGLLVMVVTVLLLAFYLFNRIGGLEGLTLTHLRSATWIIYHDIEAIFYATIIVLFLSINRYSLLTPIENALAKCGEFSYSMYWLHFPVIKAVCVMLRRYHIFYPGSFNTIVLVGFLIVLPTIVFIAGLSYTFYEKPFLQFREKALFHRWRCI